MRSLERDSLPCNIARAGDNITVSLQGVDANCVISGGVLCHPDFPVAVSDHLELKILVLDVQTPILIGSQVIFLPKMAISTHYLLKVIKFHVFLNFIIS